MVSLGLKENPMRAIVIPQVADPVPAGDEALTRAAFEDIAEAHRVMEAGQAAGGLVVAGA